PARAPAWPDRRARRPGRRGAWVRAPAGRGPRGAPWPRPPPRGPRGAARSRRGAARRRRTASVGPRRAGRGTERLAWSTAFPRSVFAVVALRRGGLGVMGCERDLALGAEDGEAAAVVLGDAQAHFLLVAAHERVQELAVAEHLVVGLVERARVIGERDG